MVLASASPVLAAMFQNDRKENHQRIVNIEDIEVAVMEHLLRFIYSGDADLNNVKVDKLLTAADKYGIKVLCLRRLCFYYFPTSSVANCI